MTFLTTLGADKRFSFISDFARIQGVTVNIDSLQAGLDAMMARAESREGFVLFTANLDHVVKLRSDLAFQKAYSEADFVSADGWPIVWLLRRQGQIVQRATGSDMVEPLCARAAEKGLPLYFIGPSPASQTRAIEILRRKSPGLIVAGAEAPKIPSEIDDETVATIAERIRASGARICIASLGSPKQELLAAALRRVCPDVGFLGVGAAMDFISGHAARAPQIIQSMKLEWLWRMAHNPRRLGLRYILCFSWFAAAVILQTHFR